MQLVLTPHDGERGRKHGVTHAAEGGSGSCLSARRASGQIWEATISQQSQVLSDSSIAVCCCDLIPANLARRAQ